MTSTEHLPQDFIFPFKYSFDLLSRSNIILLHSNKALLRFYVKSIFITFCAISYQLSLTVNMSKAFSGESQFFELAHSLPVFLVATQGIVKSAIILFKKEDIKYLILELESMWKRDITKFQLEKRNSLLKTLNFIYKIFYWMNIIGSWQYMLAPMFETLYRKFILQQQCELLLPFSCSYPFDPTSNWFIYMAVYVFQVYSMLRLVYVYLGGQLLMISLCAHLTIQFMILRNNILRIQPSSKRSEDEITSFDAEMGLNDIIRTHQRLIRLSNLLDCIFNKIIFMKLLFATIIICFFGLVAKFSRGPTDMINNVVGVIASIMPIYILCYYGQLLMEESEGIALSVYQNLWYEDTVTSQKLRSFIILRSQKPCRMTSLKYTPITLNTFTKVLSTTWSYFSLANSLYQEHD